MNQFNKSTAEWTELGGGYTAQEIKQQPEIWDKIITLFKSEESLIKRDLEKINIKEMQIILTGAGTSEFAGQSLENYLRELEYDAKAVPTTDLVSNPRIYLQFEKPTLLVSFARSGNSPESLAAINVVRKVLKTKLHTINITCNNAGELALQSQKWQQNYLFILPKATNDKGFAMTSSFTGMILWAMLLFGKTHDIEANIKLLSANINSIEDAQLQILQTEADTDNDRIVFLGSNHLKGFAHEGSLKTLELSGGLVSTSYNSFLGFRHGPKSIVNNKTTIICLLSTHKYTRKYDIDLITELYKDKISSNIVVLDYKRNNKVADICHQYIYAKTSRQTHDIYAGLFYIYLCQIFALYKSVYLRRTPDNPCPSGEVNRVVQGVKIHRYNY